MSDATWTRLAAPFGDAAVTWDVLSVDEDDASALVAPRLVRDELVARLDQVCGVAGWSLGISAAPGGAMLCTLEIGGVRKSAVADPLPAGAAATADAALAAAAWLFGMRLSEPHRPHRVPYDVVAGAVLDGPGAEGVAGAAATDPGEVEPVEDLREVDARGRGLSSEGLRMIDRLIERLKDEGQGLAAARLLVRYGGYGKDAETARELYGALRELLKRRDEGRVAT